MTEAAAWGSAWPETLTGMSKDDLLKENTSHHGHDRGHDRAPALTLALVLTPALARAQPLSCQQAPGERAGQGCLQWPGTWAAEKR